MSANSSKYFSLYTGIGVVIANMIGSGVFLSTGYMMQNTPPDLILLSWVIGAVIALSGALAYAEISQINGRSGGEYRYLYDYLHPYLGYLAGWASLLIGFSAPIAIDAFAAGAFLNTVGVQVSPKMVGMLIIIAITLAHCFQFSWSRSIQNGLVSTKFLFILVFIAIGLVGGHNSWPEWNPPVNHNHFSLTAFLENQYWIAFAFSGWNAAIYIAGEYKNPRKDVFFSLITGSLIVTVVYLTINWIFIANLTPQVSVAVFDHDKTQITLAHVALQQIIGTNAAQAASLIACIVFVSAISSMTLVGPRIYAQMADDGLLPKLFANRAEKPPLFSVLLQSGIALFLLYTQSIRDIILSCSAVLMLFSMFTVLILIKIQKSLFLPKVSKLSLASALFYVASMIPLLYIGISTTQFISYVLIAIISVGSLGYWIANKYKRVNKRY